MTIDKGFVENIGSSNKVPWLKNAHLRLDKSKEFLDLKLRLRQMNVTNFEILTLTPKALISYLRTSWKPSNAYLVKQYGDLVYIRGSDILTD